ncbi:MAG: c-type cytochrome [Gammaproteobacteria bacterium]
MGKVEVLSAIFGLCLVLTTSVYASSHHPQAFLDSISGTKNEGQAIVKHYCANCHAAHPLISLGAPRMGHPEDWQERLKQDPKVLWQHTSEGFHAMPARGGCFECSDEQLKKAILDLTTGSDY